MLQRFAQTFAEVEHPANVHLLPSFAKVQLEADGVHLNPISGLDFVLYLFESAEDIMSRKLLSTSEQVELQGSEARLVSDRVAVLEQDHARLHRSYELQSAVNAELLDLHENIRFEPFFMIQGLPRIPKTDPKQWSERAKSDVAKILSDMGFSDPIQFVLNSTGRGKDSRVMYKVKMETAEVSRSIRSKFGSYFAGGQDARPASLASVSIRNCVTIATLARIAILQLLARRYKDSNPGSKTQVITYEPRPILRLTPPQGASDRRVQTFNFIEAVSKLPVNFSQDEIDGLLKRISPSLHGRLRATLVVVDDDMVKKKKVFKKSTGAAGSSADQGKSESTELTTPEGQNGRKRKQKSSPAGSQAKK